MCVLRGSRIEHCATWRVSERGTRKVSEHASFGLRRESALRKLEADGAGLPSDDPKCKCGCKQAAVCNTTWPAKRLSGSERSNEKENGREAAHRHRHGIHIRAFRFCQPAVDGGSGAVDGREAAQRRLRLRRPARAHGPVHGQVRRLHRAGAQARAGRAQPVPHGRGRAAGCVGRTGSPAPLSLRGREYISLSLGGNRTDTTDARRGRQRTSA